MDTRPGSPTVDGQQTGRGALGAGVTVDLPIVGRAGVPATGVGAVALNVTVTEPSKAGYLTVFPSGTARPVASNVDFDPNQTIPNMVIVAPGANGAVSIYNFTGSSHVVVDVLGWFPTGSSFTGVAPARVLETRASLPTVDGRRAGDGKLGASATRSLEIAGRAGVPPSGAGAVAINVTVTNPTKLSYLTVFPSGGSRPLASTLNFGPRQTIANMAIVPLGADGRISLFNFAGDVDVIVDVLGWFPTGGTFTGLTPARLLDTRSKGATVDGRSSGGGLVGGSSSVRLNVAGRGGVPSSGAGAVVLNVTAVVLNVPTFVTVHPGGSRRPNASNLNAVADQTTANMVIVPVGDHGQVTLFNYAGAAHLVVDVLGWFPNPTSPPTSYGNDATLRSTGIGAVSFGASAPDVVAALTPLLGEPNDGGTIEFAPDGSGTYVLGIDWRSDFRFNRSICFSPERSRLRLCAEFGGAQAASMTFVGWRDDGQQILSDAHGITTGALGGDFADSIVVDGGACCAYGVAHTPEGVTLQVFADPPFFTYDRAGNLIVHQPTPADVVVVGMSAGQVPWYDVDC